MCNYFSYILHRIKENSFLQKNIIFYMYTSCIFLILSFYFSVFFFYKNIIEKDVLLSYLGACKTILKNLHITTHSTQKFFLSLYFTKCFFFTRVSLNLINRYLYKKYKFPFYIQKLLDIYSNIY